MRKYGRATEIETFDHATVVIPNSNLVSGGVKNWLMPDRAGRIRLGVSVSYDSDTDRVVKVLIECARRHPEVLAHPVPMALLMQFAASKFECASGSTSTDACGSAVSLKLCYLLRPQQEAFAHFGWCDCRPYPQLGIRISTGTLLKKGL